MRSKANKNESRQKLPSQLRRMRTLVGFSQDELGYRTGIDASRISRLERGYGTPRNAEKILFARVLDVPPDILFPATEVPEA